MKTLLIATLLNWNLSVDSIPLILFNVWAINDTTLMTELYAKESIDEEQALLILQSDVNARLTEIKNRKTRKINSKPKTKQ